MEKMMAQCPKCGGSMEEGFLIENDHGGSRSVSQWQAGAPEKSFWLGIKKRDPQYPIRSMRCGRCGFLENYAN
jgi:predicted nucleic-acid-binding Zn-ribbon protein